MNPSLHYKINMPVAYIDKVWQLVHSGNSPPQMRDQKEMNLMDDKTFLPDEERKPYDSIIKTIIRTMPMKKLRRTHIARIYCSWLERILYCQRLNHQ